MCAVKLIHIHTCASIPWHVLQYQTGSRGASPARRVRLAQGPPHLADSLRPFHSLDAAKVQRVPDLRPPVHVRISPFLPIVWLNLCVSMRTRLKKYMALFRAAAKTSPDGSALHSSNAGRSFGGIWPEGGVKRQETKVYTCRPCWGIL